MISASNRALYGGEQERTTEGCELTAGKRREPHFNSFHTEDFCTVCKNGLQKVQERPGTYNYLMP